MIACTIAIPGYGRPEATCRAIESALQQELDGLEVLVVDDLSPGDTWETVEAFAREAARRYPKPRLRLVQNAANVGLFGNFNRCLELAEGKYIRILCNDDRLMPGSIAKEVELLEQHPQAVFLSTRGREMTADGQLHRIFADEFPAGVYHGEEMIGKVLWLIAHYNSNPLNYPSGILIRGETAREIGQFTDRYRLVGDIDYWFRLFTRGEVIVADHIGCEVMFHVGQVGSSVLMSGKMVDEFYALATDWRKQLEARHIHKRIVAQFAGNAVYTAARLQLRAGRPDVARLYWQSARASGLSLPERLLAATRFAWMVQSRKVRKRVTMPPA